LKKPISNHKNKSCRPKQELLKEPYSSTTMRLSTIFAASLLTSTAAFAPNAPLHLNSRLSPLAMSTEAINYVITGNNIEVTDSLTEYVNKKLDNTVGKLAATGSVKECDVHLSVNKNPKVSVKFHVELCTFAIIGVNQNQDLHLRVEVHKIIIFPNGTTCMT